MSKVKGKRGDELTVTGSAFNNGTTAGVYVLGRQPTAYADAAAWWVSLNCKEMVEAVGKMYDGAAITDANPDGMPDADADSPNADMFCAQFPDDDDMTPELSSYAQGVVKRAFGEMECDEIKDEGTSVGGALTGSDDVATVTFEVTAPTFKPGNVNHICMFDGEGRASISTVEDYELEPSIKVVPDSVRTGDTVNVFAQDFSNNPAGFSLLKIAGRTDAPNGVALKSFVTDDENISIGRRWFGNFRGPRRL